MPEHVTGPLRFLADDEFVSESVLRHEAVQSLSSRARAAYELAAGSTPFARERPASGFNPQGAIGVDLSGPPWGSAILHPVAWKNGRPPNGGVTGERSITDNVSDEEITIGPWIFWNRPHATLRYPSVAPYSRLFLGFRAAMASGGGETLTVTCRTLSPQTGNVLEERSEDFSVTTTDTRYTSSTAYFAGCGSGHVAVSVGFKTTSTSVLCSIYMMSICQMVKRSH
ncbi:MAG: hypothetical protein VW405_12330 [Rhodospirillaceae bacterium]